jgi:tRNA threonylcarbamoyladenosine dehydratase
VSAASGGRHAEAADASSPLHVEAFARVVASPSTAPAASWRPQFIKLAPHERERLEVICRQHRLTLLDPMERQLADLAAVRLPSSDAAERQRFIEETVAAHGGADAYGSWVHLPWAAKVVHLLDEEPYFEVITNRNRDKITREEQRRLRAKRVGVVGLSVGGEAAVTVAQEHLCGEIVLADFDGLDLSNLNRLSAGFDELGENKAILVARRIARLDPYVRVTVLHGGVTAANLEQFLTGLDLLIEECDGLAIKYEVRRLARERGLNIVFAADERGFLSVEPYADWPELRPFHGRIDAPQPSREAFPTPLAFMHALTEWMGGWGRVSERSRRSLAQVGDTLCGYPQLASEARYAAGQVGHVARRLLLGERLPPYMGHLDLDQLLPSVAHPDPGGS